MVIDHHEPFIHTRETRTVADKTTRSDGPTTMIDGQLHLTHPTPQQTIKTSQVWSDDVLVIHWELIENGMTYVSDIRTSLSADGQVMTMAEHYREPGMERTRDWVFERDR